MGSTSLLLSPCFQLLAYPWIPLNISVTYLRAARNICFQKDFSDHWHAHIQLVRRWKSILQQIFFKRKYLFQHAGYDVLDLDVYIHLVKKIFFTEPTYLKAMKRPEQGFIKQSYQVRPVFTYSISRVSMNCQTLEHPTGFCSVELFFSSHWTALKSFLLAPP